jgi:hypothetical protein
MDLARRVYSRDLKIAAMREIDGGPASREACAGPFSTPGASRTHGRSLSPILLLFGLLLWRRFARWCSGIDLRGPVSLCIEPAAGPNRARGTPNRARRRLRCCLHPPDLLQLRGKQVGLRRPHRLSCRVLIANAPGTCARASVRKAASRNDGIEQWPRSHACLDRDVCAIGSRVWRELTWLGSPQPA